MAVGHGEESTGGGDDQFQMVVATNGSNEQSMSGNLTSENLIVESEALDIEELGDTKAPDTKATILDSASELGVSGTSDDLDQDLDMTGVPTVDEQKTELSVSVQSESKDQDLDMSQPAEPQKISGSVEGTEETHTRADFLAEEGSTQSSNNDKMDVDPPTAEQEEEIEEMEDIEEEDISKSEENEETETTDSIWSLPSILDDGNEPRLSLKQLIIMALVISPTRTLSIEEICHWINDSFKYYKNLTFQHTLSPGKTFNWMGELNDILHRYDFVTQPTLQQTGEGGNGENGKVVLYLPPGQEWHILPKPDKMKDRPFRFLDLPIDIRLMIFEFALVRPLPKKQGWIIDPNYTARRKDNYRKSHRTPQRLTEVGPHGWELRTEGMDVVLAVLSVSKQVFTDASPVFYRGNFLEFESVVTLSRFLDGVPYRRKVCFPPIHPIYSPAQVSGKIFMQAGVISGTEKIMIADLRQWIRNLVLHYDPPIFAHACTNAFTLLRGTKLRNLQLYLNEDKLIRRHDLTRFSDPIPRLPGMKVLAELRGLKLVGMQGPHSKTRKFLVKMTDCKKNDTPDDDEQMVFKRQREQEKFQLALKRSYHDVRNANRKKAAEALKAKQAKEKEVQKQKKEAERKIRAEELAKEKKERAEAREQKRQEREETIAKADQAKTSGRVNKKDKKKITTIRAKNNGGKAAKPADEDSSSEEDNDKESSREDKSESESEEEPEEEKEFSPPPRKRARTIPGTATLAEAKRDKANKNNNSSVAKTKSGRRNSKIPNNPAPAPRPIVNRSATGGRSVTTKSGIVAKGLSSGVKKTTPAVKKTAVRKVASGSIKKNEKGGRKSEMASVLKPESDRVVGDSD